MSTKYTKYNFVSELQKAINDPAVFAISEDGGIEIYCDYRDELSNGTIADLFRINRSNDTGVRETPRMRFEDLLSEWANEYAVCNGNTDFEYIVKEYFSKEAYEYYLENTDWCQDVMREICYFYYPEEHFNKTVLVNILLDTGNANYDFTLDDCFSIYGYGTLREGSSILFLAKEQGKEEELKRELLAVYNGKSEDDIVDPFIKSVVVEMMNNGSYMNTVTFCVKMSLFKLFDLWEVAKIGEGYIELSKDATCGLFNPWDGGGSLFEIELEKNIKIPAKYIHTICPDGYYRYDVKNVYEVIDSFWKGEAKAVS